MSRTFLDAPRALVQWRRVALAASVLLALSGIYQLAQPPQRRRAPPLPVPLHDARRHLLLPLLGADPGMEQADLGPEAPASAHRGHESFFRLRTPQPVSTDGAAGEGRWK